MFKPIFIFFFVGGTQGSTHKNGEFAMTSKKYNRNFTLSERAWNWLNKLKYEQQVNLSAYVNALILKDINKKEVKANDEN